MSTDRHAERLAVDEQCRLVEQLETALKSRTRYTVQCMPHGTEIIECESGDLVNTIRLVEVVPEPPQGWLPRMLGWRRLVRLRP